MIDGSIEYIIEHDKIDVKTYIRKHLGISAKALTKLKSSGIFVNFEHATVRKIMQKGDVLSIVPEIKKETNYTAENIPLDIIFDDENFLIVNKPAFMPVYPAGVHMTNSLLAGFAFLYPNQTFRPIYRLDRNTSGLMCIAKNKIASSSTVTKEYFAVCEGETNEHAVIDTPICLAPNSRIKRTIGSGQSAKTEYFKENYFANHTSLRIKIYTGRTHQIRVHMSSIGHPLAGDDLYGGKTDKISRHALHCAKIHVQNKALNFDQEFQSPIPDDIKQLTNL